MIPSQALIKHSMFVIIVHCIVCLLFDSLSSRFYARDSGLLKFKIHAGFLGRPSPPSARRLVAFTFHPFAPFGISVQRTNAEYVVNFHIRHIDNTTDHM